MRLGVPFIALRQLGAVEDQLGRPILPSVGWRTGQSGAPPDSYCSCPVRDLLPILVQPTIADLWQLAHRTVRCPLPTIGAGHASPADCATDRCAGGRWLTGQSGAPPDSPVNYSRGVLGEFLRATSSSRMTHRTVRCTTGQSVNYSRTILSIPESSRFTVGQPGAPDTVRCATRQSGVPGRAVVGCTQPTLFQSVSSLLSTVSST